MSHQRTSMAGLERALVESKHSPRFKSLGGRNFAARCATLSFFILQGSLFGALASTYPSICSSRAISDAQAGLVFLFLFVGMSANTPVVAICMERVRNKPTLFVYGICTSGSFPLVALSDEFWGLSLAMMLFGCMKGGLDVAANSSAVLTEIVAGSPILGSYYGYYSLSIALGALIAGISLANGCPILLLFEAFCISCLLGCLLFSFGLYDGQDEAIILRHRDGTNYNRWSTNDSASASDSVQNISLLHSEDGSAGADGADHEAPMNLAGTNEIGVTSLSLSSAAQNIPSEQRGVSTISIDPPHMNSGAGPATTAGETVPLAPEEQGAANIISVAIAATPAQSRSLSRASAWLSNEAPYLQSPFEDAAERPPQPQPPPPPPPTTTTTSTRSMTTTDATATPQLPAIDATYKSRIKPSLLSKSPVHTPTTVPSAPPLEFESSFPYRCGPNGAPIMVVEAEPASPTPPLNSDPPLSPNSDNPLIGKQQYINATPLQHSVVSSLSSSTNTATTLTAGTVAGAGSFPRHPTASHAPHAEAHTRNISFTTVEDRVSRSNSTGGSGVQCDRRRVSGVGYSPYPLSSEPLIEESRSEDGQRGIICRSGSELEPRTGLGPGFEDQTDLSSTNQNPLQESLLSGGRSSHIAAFRSKKQNRRLLILLYCVGFLGAFGESSILTWSVIYYNRSIAHSGSSAVQTSGLVGFMVAMAAGRFSCDYLRRVAGRRVMVAVGGMLAFGGLFVVYLAPLYPFAVVMACMGFVLCGMGLSTLLPTVFSSAGHIKGQSDGSAMALSLACAFLGFMTGSPLMGFISSASGSLRTAVLVHAIILALLLPLGFVLPPEQLK